MAIQVTMLPATIDRFTADPIESVKRRRAAAYARVSSDHAEQLTSYAAQVEYYTGFIHARSDLIFAGVYADEGITGTSTAHREGFRQMVGDALAGKIDLIITKSVSRFARNTVDSLSTIRLLKAHGVECFFEKENISTFDSKGELLLTIMSSLAQEESRSVSENCTWGQRKRFADGKVTVPFSRFLGYDRGADGGLVVNEEQAQTVRRIYELFLRGETPCGIARQLTAEGVPTPSGAQGWSRHTVKSILTNEKYKGDALLQKVFTVDFLTKRKKLNEGEVPQYYVEGSHEGIISAELYEQAQARFDEGRQDAPSEPLFAGRLTCGLCGGVYEPRVLHSTHGFRKALWQCPRTECTAPRLLEAEIRLVFVKAVNSLPEGAPCGRVTDFDRELWRSGISGVTITSRGDICVLFSGGGQARVSL